MKINIINAGVVLIAIVFLSVNTLYADNGIKKIDHQKSKIEWLGKKVTGEHSGTIKVKEGSIVLNGDKIEKGSFIVDMTSIINTDIKGEGSRAKLERHLKSEDFFGVEKFPQAKFVIDDSKYLNDGNYKIKGDITIKGITQPIEFKVNLHAHADLIHINGKVIIDRSKFNIRYGSGTFFENLGDKTIYDDFELNLDLYLR